LFLIIKKLIAAITSIPIKMILVFLSFVFEFPVLVSSDVSGAGDIGKNFNIL